MNIVDHEAVFDLVGAFDSFVPPSFYRVLHLARVIFSSQRVLDATARGKLGAIVGEGGDRSRERDAATVSPGVPILGGYQVTPVIRRIKTFDEIPFIDPAELAMKEVPELVREAEERELWVRVAHREGEQGCKDEVARLVDGGSRDALNDAEQKLYVLMDKSVSMRADHRHLYAKALILWFLREKMRHGANAMLFYRGFAPGVSPLIRARSKQEIPLLVNEILGAEPDEKGTNIQLALLTAIADIKASSLLHDAQILLVSDGLDILDTEEIRAAAGDRIRIHMVKLGGDDIDPTDAEMKDLAERFHIRVEAKEDLKRVYVDTIHEQFRAITDSFFEVPDVADEDLRVSPEEPARLHQIASARILSEPVDGPRAEDAHRLAIFLTNSVDFLRPHADEAIAAELDALQDEVNLWIQKRLRSDQAVRETLASKNLNLVLERNLIKRVSDNRALDPGALLQSDELAIALRFWNRSGGHSLGISIPWWKIAALLLKRLTGKRQAKGKG